MTSSRNCWVTGPPGELIGSGIGGVIDTSDLAVRTSPPAPDTRRRIGVGDMHTDPSVRDAVVQLGAPLAGPVDGTLPTLMIIEESADTPDGLSGVRERWLADHDELTSLLNRRGFNRAVRDGRPSFPQRWWWSTSTPSRRSTIATAITPGISYCGFRRPTRAYRRTSRRGVRTLRRRRVRASGGGRGSRSGVAPAQDTRPRQHGRSSRGIGEFTVSYGWSQVLNPDQIDHARVRADGHMYDARSVKGGPPRQGRHNRGPHR